MPLTKPMLLACVLALSACASPSSLQCPPVVDLRHAAPPKVEPLGLKPRMAEMLKGGEAAKAAGGQYRAAGDAVQKLTATYQRQIDQTKRLRAGLAEMGISNAAQAEGKLRDAVERTTKALERQRRAHELVSKQRAAVEANKTARADARGALFDGAAMAASLAAPLKMAIDFESSMADVDKVNSRTNASGQPIAPMHITRAAGDQHRWHTADRTSYTGVRAYWTDGKRARRKGVVAGNTKGSVKTLKDTYSSAEAARQAAQSEMQRVDRGAATLSLALALGRPHLMPQAAVTVEGFKPEIDGEGWLVKSVEHALGDGGFTTQIELERQGSGDAQAHDDVEHPVNDPNE